MLKSHFPVPPLVKFQMEMPHLDGKSNSSVAVQKPTNEYQRKAFFSSQFQSKRSEKIRKFPEKEQQDSVCYLLHNENTNWKWIRISVWWLAWNSKRLIYYLPVGNKFTFSKQANRKQTAMWRFYLQHFESTIN